MAAAASEPRFSLDRLVQWDRAVMLRVMNVRTRKLTRAMRAITHTPVWLSFLLLALAAADDVGPLHGALQGGVAAGVAALMVQAVKLSVRRQRPVLVECLSRTLDRYSFPSGHSGAAFAVVAASSFIFPPLGMLLLPLAVVVAFSRVYLGVHYASDVIMGAVLGTLVGAGTLAMGMAGEMARFIAG